MPRLIALLLLLVVTSPARGDSMPGRYAVAEVPTPVFNTPQIRSLFSGNTGSNLKLDRCGQMRELEFIALAGTVFMVHGETVADSGTVYRVTTSEYPYSTSKGYFIDSRFVRLASHKPPERTRYLPSRESILASLRSAVRLPYVWGGNVRQGVPELLTFYPPAETLPSGAIRNQWQLRGLDCSGLLYESTGGWTPRNTSTLISFGLQIDAAGRSPTELAGSLQPLDLIVWSGHVLIVLDRGEVIESVLSCGNRQGGVVINRLADRLAEIMRTRRPAERFDDAAEKNGQFFMVRRWYGRADTPTGIGR